MKKIHLVKDFDGSVMCGEVNPAYVTIEIAKVTCTDCFNAERANKKGEKLCLVCRSCGEAFDEFATAKAHESDPEFIDCDEGYDIVPESEAF